MILYMLMPQRLWVAKLLLQGQQPHSLALGAAASCGSGGLHVAAQGHSTQLHCNSFSCLPAHPCSFRTRPRTRMGCSFMAKPMLPLIFSLRIRNACSREARLCHVEHSMPLKTQALMVRRTGWSPVLPAAGTEGGLAHPGRPTHLLRAQLAHDHLHKVVACGAQQAGKAQEKEASGSVLSGPMPLGAWRLMLPSSRVISFCRYLQWPAAAAQDCPWAATASNFPRRTANGERDVRLVTLCWCPLSQAALREQG